MGFVELLAVLEEKESGHGTDTELGSNLGQLVDVDLVELGVGVLVAELLDLGGDGLARTAPGSEAVNDDVAGGLAKDLLVEFGLTVETDKLIKVSRKEGRVRREEKKKGGCYLKVRR